MRETGDSRLNVPIRATPNYYGANVDRKYRPALNIDLLLRLIADYTDVPLAQEVGKGKKRAAPSDGHDAKRKKQNDGSKVSASTTTYPMTGLEDLSNAPEPTVPVMLHTFHLHYTTASSVDELRDDQFWDGADWLEEEQELVSAVNALNESDVVDLGTVSFVKSEAGVVGTVDGSQEDSRSWLFHLTFLSAPNDVASVFRWMPLMASKGSAFMKASAKLVRVKPDEDSLLPFRLDVETLVSITPRLLARSDDHRLDQAQTSLIRFLYRPESPRAVINIPFLYSILQPAPPLTSLRAIEAMQPPELIPTLLPFQRRTLAWLLGREGKTVTDSGDIVPIQNQAEYSFWKRIDEGNLTFYYNGFTDQLAKSHTPTSPAFGAILAEEPGLGKTLEMISLILLNPAPPERNPMAQVTWDKEMDIEVKAVKATLIVTPPTLASQWMDELALHAPTLKVLRYDGWAKLGVPITPGQAEQERVRRRKANDARKGKTAWLDPDDVVDWCTYAHGFDVVVTTYGELRNDLNVARPIPKRPRRDTAIYSNLVHPRSPLIMCEWHRVLMDEVQMVGGGKVEEMVSLIPRLSSFAVSGTPARAQVSDLMHVLKFLRVDGVVGSAWENLLQPKNTSFFTEFIQHYSVRTVKSTLTAELTIPQQTRFLVPVEIGRIERHVYDQALESVLLELGLDARGVAATADWEVDAGVLRSCVRRLRGICTHPLVGQLQGPDRFYKSGALKTMEEVLQGMQDTNWRNVMEELRTKVQLLVRQAQLRQNAPGGNARRHQEALTILIEAEKECKKLVDEIDVELTSHLAKGEILKQGHVSKKDGKETVSAKGKEREVSPDEYDADTYDDGIPKTVAGEEFRNKRHGLRSRLREANIVLHRVKFLQGDVYNVLGPTFEPEESAAYAFCEALRRDLLKVTAEDANNGMADLNVDATQHGINEDTLTVKIPFLPDGKKRSADLVEEFHDIAEIVLNEQSKLLWVWRSQMHRLLTQRLVTNSNGEAEADGQEYQRSLDDQGEAETYLQAYASLLADRRQALVNERTLLAAHDNREKRLRQTKAAQQANGIAFDDNHDDIELQPEHEVLRKQLLEQRKGLLEDLDARSVRSILVDMSSAYSKIHRETDPEKVLLKQLIADVRKFIADQGKALDKLDADLILFRKAFNQRILYFRQLQEISDTVTQVTWEGQTYDEAVQECENELENLDTSLKTNRARHRYLENLQQKDRDDAHDDDDDCILCGVEFERGFITACAHVFCEACMKAWIQRKEGKVCPVCRVPIDHRNLQRFSVNPVTKVQVMEEHKPGEAVPQSHRKIDYNMISPEVYDVIQSMESFGDYGQKMQTLVRHLLYIQETDPGAKSIVFSAWADSLQILESALRENAIPCLRIDKASYKGTPPAKRFKEDPHIQVLLLHGERENAGLNITCASRVFLLESVVQHGFEIQAIARIDRLGQTRPTEVYCYYAEDTLEKNILDMAARRGLSLYTKDNSAGTLNVSSLDEDADQVVDVSAVKTKTKKTQKTNTKALKGDFISKTDDMLAILFPHMYEELEYLLPKEEDDVAMIDDTVNGQVNAVAGPSRAG